MTERARVLVVEDESIISADIQDRLKALGYEVAGCADNGREAIQKAGALRPDVVLMDINLKGEMEGTVAAEQIHTRLQLPVVFLTASSSDGAFFRALHSGPFGFILKPFEDATLKTSIEIALYKHRMEREREDLIGQLQAALAQVKTLSGMLPICGRCKKVRDDNGYWNLIEAYIEKHSDASFSHGLCPECEINYLEVSGLPVSEELREDVKNVI